MKFGISFTAGFFNQAGALVLVYRDGSVQVNHGGTEMGQGLHTKIRQIAAQSLGVPLEAVRVMPTRTDKVPNTSATAASAGTDLNGAAVLDACTQIQSRLVPSPPACLTATRPRFALMPDRCLAKVEDRPSAASSSKLRTGSASRSLRMATIAPRKSISTRRRRRASRSTISRTPRLLREVEIDGFTGEHRVLRAICSKTSANRSRR